MFYHVHNTSRALASRAQRYSSPTHRGMVQVIGGQRIVRGRPLVVDEETLRRNLGALKEREAAGYIEVRTPDGRKVNLDNLEPAPVPASPALPVFVPDSMNNDIPTGRPLPIYPDGAVQSNRPAEEEPLVTAEAELHIPPTVDAPTATTPEDASADVEYHEEGGGVSRKGGKGKRR